MDIYAKILNTVNKQFNEMEIGYYIMTKLDLSQEHKVGSAFENQYNLPYKLD